MVRGRSSAKGSRSTQKEKNKVQAALVDVVADGKREQKVVASSSGACVDGSKDAQEAVTEWGVGDSDIDEEEMEEGQNEAEDKVEVSQVLNNENRL